MWSDRPDVGWLVVVAGLGSIATFAGVVAGCLTAVVVAVSRPPTLVWVVLFATLTVVLALLRIRTYSPEWYSWLVGRAPEDRA